MEKDRTPRTEKPDLLRIDASWDNDRFIAEAETVVCGGTDEDGTAGGETIYALVTDENDTRQYRVMTESLYDAVFCRTDGFKPGPEHIVEEYGSLREAKEAGCPWLMIFGRLDDLADVKDQILEYRWQPGDEEEL